MDAPNRACRGADLDLFFPPRREGYAKARRLCLRCPVFDECRAENDAFESVDLRRMYGFYAGETPNERLMRRLIAQRVADVA